MVQQFLDWASDQSNSNLVRTVVAILAVPGALWGAYLFIRWIRGTGIDSKIDSLEVKHDQLSALQRINRLNDVREKLLALGRAYDAAMARVDELITANPAEAKSQLLSAAGVVGQTIELFESNSSEFNSSAVTAIRRKVEKAQGESDQELLLSLPGEIMRLVDDTIAHLRRTSQSASTNQTGRPAAT